MRNEVKAVQTVEVWNCDSQALDELFAEAEAIGAKYQDEPVVLGDDETWETLFSQEAVIARTGMHGECCNLIHKERADATMSRYISDKAERAWGL